MEAISRTMNVSSCICLDQIIRSDAAFALSLESRNKQSASVRAAEEVSLGGADPASISRLLVSELRLERRSESIRAAEESRPLVSVCLRVL